MNTLIIPDFHEQVDRIPLLEPLIATADRIVSLGDWCDTFQKHRVEETIAFMLKHKDDERWEWIIGNHDAHYMFKHRHFRCSGYQPLTQVLWASRLPPEFLAKWKIWTEVDDFTVSHAGFHPDTLHLHTPTKHKEALQMARNGGFHKMWVPGADSGGNVWEIGGPMWLRWFRLKPIVGMPQIVGHTPAPDVRARLDTDGVASFCLDTHLQHVLWIRDGVASVETL